MKSSFCSLVKGGTIGLFSGGFARDFFGDFSKDFVGGFGAGLGLLNLDKRLIIFFSSVLSWIDELTL